MEIDEDFDELEHPLVLNAIAATRTAAGKAHTRDTAPPNGMFPGGEVSHTFPDLSARY